ncbi:MAG: terminase family protein [Dehalococcoidales bacterium]
MARASLAAQILELRALTDPKHRHTDLALRLVTYDHVGGKLIEVGRSRVYGGVWDNWSRSYAEGATPQSVIEVPVSKNQLELIECTANKRLIYAGRGGGKSHGGGVALLAMGLERPGGQAQIVAPTFAIGQILWDKLLDDLPTGRLLHPSLGVQVAKKRLVLRNGFTLRFGSADRPQSLRGGDADLVFVDERQDVPQRAVDIVMLQLRKKGGYTLVQIGTPDAGSDFHAEFERYSADPDCWVKHFTSFANPFIPQGEASIFASAQKTMDPKLYRQEVLAEWITLGDQVYPHFERTTHCRRYKDRVDVLLKQLASTVLNTEERRRIGRDITSTVTRAKFGISASHFVGLDWGVSPMCCNVWKVVDGGPGIADVAWAVDEIYFGDAGDPTRMALELKRRGYHPNSTIIVADASDAQASSNIRLMKKQGFKVVRPQPDSRRNPGVRNRINATNAKMLNASNEVTWYCDPKTAPRTATAYQRQQLKNGKPAHDEHSHFTSAGDYAIVRIWPAAANTERLQIRYAT